MPAIARFTIYKALNDTMALMTSVRTDSTNMLATIVAIKLLSCVYALELTVIEKYIISSNLCKNKSMA